MNPLSKTGARLSLLAAFMLALTIGVAGPASAGESCSLLWSGYPKVCTQYTGTWPGGQVRGNGSQFYYAMKLQRCGTTRLIDCGWLTVASGHHIATTAYVNVTRFGWFRTCAQLQQGGTYPCGVAVYLGE